MKIEKSRLEVLVVTHLYLFPGAVLKRGGLIIHESLSTLSRCGPEIRVAFYIPLVWSYIKCMKFDWSNLTFRPYYIDGISVRPVFYIPRLSSISPGIDIFLKYLSFRFCFWRSLKREDRNKIGLVYGQTAYPDGPLVQTISDFIRSPYMIILRGSDVNLFSAKKFSIRRLVKRSLVKARLVLSVSTDLKNRSALLFGKNYVDSVLYTVCRTHEFLKKRPITQPITNFIYVGALVRSKGIFELIDAISILARANAKVNMTLVGGGSELQNVKDYIGKRKVRDHFILKGKISKRSDLAWEINKADVMLFPSHAEGLPNAVVEGVACERAVICTDVGGSREIASQNIAFQLIPKHDVIALVTAIERVMNTDEKVLRHYASENRKSMIERFGLQAQEHTFKMLLRELEKGGS